MDPLSDRLVKGQGFDAGKDLGQRNPMGFLRQIRLDSRDRTYIYILFLPIIMGMLEVASQKRKCFL